MRHRGWSRSIQTVDGRTDAPAATIAMPQAFTAWMPARPERREPRLDVPLEHALSSTTPFIRISI